MTNISIEPREGSLAEIIGDTDDGIFMTTNQSWSIDDKRINFQFGCEAAWRIEHGTLTTMYKNPNYTGITPEFWGSCDAVAGREEWVVWGTPNCGKGQPGQVGRVGHGTSPGAVPRRAGRGALMPGLIGPDAFRRSAEAAMELPGVDGVEVLFVHDWGGLTRFANSQIHQIDAPRGHRAARARGHQGSRGGGVRERLVARGSRAGGPQRQGDGRRGGPRPDVARARAGRARAPTRAPASTRPRPRARPRIAPRRSPRSSRRRPRASRPPAPTRPRPPSWGLPPARASSAGRPRRWPRSPRW